MVYKSYRKTFDTLRMSPLARPPIISSRYGSLTIKAIAIHKLEKNCNLSVKVCFLRMMPFFCSPTTALYVEYLSMHSLAAAF